MCANTVMNGLSCPEKVLIINGSPHQNGHTARLIRAARDMLPQETQIFQWDCFRQMPLPCDDCGYCRTKNGCSKPDLHHFYEQLEQADLLIFATPIYHRSCTGPMKILLDRLQRYWSARFIRGIRPPIKKPKNALLIAVSGSPTPEGGKILESQLTPQLTVLNTRLIGSIQYYGGDGNAPLEPAIQELREILSFPRNYPDMML